MLKSVGLRGASSSRARRRAARICGRGGPDESADTRPGRPPWLRDMSLIRISADGGHGQARKCERGPSTTSARRYGRRPPPADGDVPENRQPRPPSDLQVGNGGRTLVSLASQLRDSALLKTASANRSAPSPKQGGRARQMAFSLRHFVQNQAKDVAVSHERE
ncbi:hypothetical protein SKAU_G00054970 [Synaphobranchus kaupii]|uniref:Uncharacterized protein n=1 Tax=Synaphobranchus kaupii TaxID=118154 RepID=A0A9Q1G3R8_SYNKA|nr:hypothetical protein SKAU_G00054970 [Synaphobranchus kaupii]